jgi:hypothetical protein
MEDIEMDILKSYDDDIVVIRSLEEEDEEIYIQYEEHDDEILYTFRSVILVIIGLECIYELFKV